MRGRFEWPTLLVAAIIYLGFGLVTWCYSIVPAWGAALIGGYLVAWHGSLQHEVIHGHPTPWPCLNEALVFPSLWLWLPFRLYRESHVAHHRESDLTDPGHDPESYYLPPDKWRALSPPQRAFFWCYNTLLGRMVLGPAYQALRFIGAELGRLRRGDTRRVGAWAWHLLACALVLGWVMAVCEIPLVEYILLFVYPGLALTLVRSYAEHRAAAAPAQRTAIVEAHPLWALLFLNNNLHTLHHAYPGEPWYRLPARWRTQRSAVLAANGGYYFAGYGQIFGRYGLRPKEPPYYPLG